MFNHMVCLTLSCACNHRTRELEELHEEMSELKQTGVIMRGKFEEAKRQVRARATLGRGTPRNHMQQI